MDKKNKIIKDLVHEYISIDEKIQKIIDTEEFQRLKRVKQLTAIYIYPSANHTRFEHSLGVMKLAMDFYESIEESLKEIIEQTIKNKGDVEKKLEYYRENLKIASLLHDLGHAPLSHLGEKFYNVNQIKNQIKENLEENVSKSILNGDKGSAHELMSCYCIKKLDSKLRMLYGNIYDYEFVCRIIIGNSYSEAEDKDWKIKNIVINIVNSDSIDVDKLDYLLRDNHMCGYLTAKIDLYRFFRSIGLDTEKKCIYFKHSGVPVIQTIVDSRDSLYLWGYNHHLAVYTDAIIERVLKINEKSLDSKVFSCEGISERLASDEDIWVFLKDRYFDLKRSELKEGIEERVLLSQIFTRDLLKPLWKNLYEYNDFLKNEIINEKVINEKLKHRKQNLLKEDLKKLELEIIKKLGLVNGDVIIAERSNKFYYGNNGKEPEIYIRVKEEEKKLASLLPQKKFQDFTQVAFYVFTKDENKEKVREELKKLIKKELNF